MPEPESAPPAQTTAIEVVAKKKKVSRRQHENVFVPKIQVKLADGTFLPVPYDAEANRNASIMLAEEARNFMIKKLKDWKDKGTPMTPVEVKDALTAARIANEICIVAHENIMAPQVKDPNHRSDGEAAHLLKGMEAIARAQARGNAEAQIEATKKFLEMGRKPEEKKVIEIKAETK